MSLMAAISAELPFLRAQAEARMLDTFNIGTPTGAYTLVSGVETETLTSIATGIFGRVKVVGGLAAHTSEVGGRTAVTVSRELHLPVGSPEIPAGAVAVCTAVHATSDPTLLGARLRLSGPAPGSQTTARRLQVTEEVS